VVAIAELVDYPDKASVSEAGIVTTLRVRTTMKGEASSSGYDKHPGRHDHAVSRAGSEPGQRPAAQQPVDWI
jgi:hypothetical protein